jgi:hypothetical protein
MQAASYSLLLPLTYYDHSQKFRKASDAQGVRHCDSNASTLLMSCSLINARFVCWKIIERD